MLPRCLSASAAVTPIISSAFPTRPLARLLQSTSLRTLATASTHFKHRPLSSRLGVSKCVTASTSVTARTMSITASPSSCSSSLSIPSVDGTFFLLCDIQETFRGKILGYEKLIATSKFLMQCAETLDVPVIVTEQRPFKPTVGELLPFIEGKEHVQSFSKSRFSMMTDEVRQCLKSDRFTNRKHALLFGIEAHVCVLQTSLDLLREGYTVHLVLDAISSQNEVDRQAAMERYRTEALKQRGVDGAGTLILTSAESFLFQMLADAQHPKFKSLLPFMKELAATKKGGVAPSATANNGQPAKL